MMCCLMRHENIFKQLACQFCLMCFVYQSTHQTGRKIKVDGIEMEQLEIIEITNVFQVSRVCMSPSNYLKEGEGFLYDLMPKL